MPALYPERGEVMRRLTRLKNRLYWKMLLRAMDRLGLSALLYQGESGGIVVDGAVTIEGLTMVIHHNRMRPLVEQPNA